MKNNPDQLELDFTQARQELSQAILNFENAAVALAESKVSKALPKTDGLRAEVRRLVGIIATQSGQDFHAAWCSAYLELYLETGYHPVVQSAQKHKKTHLDAVQEEGMLPQLWNTLLRMLKEPRYRQAHEPA